jgi:hypothetical protein
VSHNESSFTFLRSDYMLICDDATKAVKPEPLRDTSDPSVQNAARICALHARVESLLVAAVASSAFRTDPVYGGHGTMMPLGCDASGVGVWPWPIAG